MANFSQAIEKALRLEGVVFGVNGLPIPGQTGLGNHPLDPGKETNYGITRKTALANGYNGPMGSIPYEKVLDIYRKSYWDMVRGDHCSSQAVAEELLEEAVNLGPWYAIMFLQVALNVLNNQQKLYPNIVEDGIAGPNTSRTLEEALAMGPDHQLGILVLMNSQQGCRYIEISKNNEGWEAFMKGVTKNRVRWPGV